MINAKVELRGNLGGEPKENEVNGKKVGNVGFATSNDYKKKSGEQVKKDPSWHELQAWNGKLEELKKYSSKDFLKVEGKLIYDTFEKDGQKHKRAKILVLGVEKIEKKEEGSQVKK